CDVKRLHQRFCDIAANGEYHGGRHQRNATCDEESLLVHFASHRSSFVMLPIEEFCTLPNAPCEYGPPRPVRMNVLEESIGSDNTLPQNVSHLPSCVRN